MIVPVNAFPVGLAESPQTAQTYRLLMRSWRLYAILAVAITLGLWMSGYSRWIVSWLAGCGLGILFWQPLWPKNHHYRAQNVKPRRWMGSLLRMAGYGLVVVLIGGSEPWPTAWVLLGLGSWHIAAIVAALSQVTLKKSILKS